MGLDTTHDCWHGPYSSFGRWRAALAEQVGRPVKTDASGELRYSLPEGEWELRNFQGWWDETPDDILDVLFVHSDCDGYIFPHHAGLLADALEAIKTGDPDIDKLTIQFVWGLRQAADAGEIVGFH